MGRKRRGLEDRHCKIFADEFLADDFGNRVIVRLHTRASLMELRISIHDDKWGISDW
ncbi:hypothetical protein Enr13x_44070 [Stieleria neptunia]|uniref:Uncharacterized protein n=1 Tax=Stieleria neptunia TaxID=2527979 RepID=A0A518HUK0_9BACT|nr:hypothetical protein Enr13x_44070 [Stieleria neptunia]